MSGFCEYIAAIDNMTAMVSSIEKNQNNAYVPITVNQDIKSACDSVFYDSILAFLAALDFVGKLTRGYQATYRQDNFSFPLQRAQFPTMLYKMSPSVSRIEPTPFNLALIHLNRVLATAKASVDVSDARF